MVANASNADGYSYTIADDASVIDLADASILNGATAIMATGTANVDNIDLSNNNGAVTVGVTIYLLGDNDIFIDGAGDDVIIGGAGADVISLANGGNDIVAFTAATDGSIAGTHTGYDAITGFTSSGDKIQFGGTLFTALDDDSNGTIVATDRAQTNVNATTDEMVLLSTALGTTFADDTNFSAFITAIGSVGTGFTTGAEVLVVAVDSASNTGIYLITSLNNDATVDANEVQLVGTVNGTLAALAGDFILTSLG